MKILKPFLFVCQSVEKKMRFFYKNNNFFVAYNKISITFVGVIKQTNVELLKTKDYDYSIFKQRQDRL